MGQRRFMMHLRQTTIAFLSRPRVARLVVCIDMDFRNVFGNFVYGSKALMFTGPTSV